MSAWTVIDPDGVRYRVERVTYEADDPGQIGNPFVRTATPILRCVPDTTCPVCHGAGDYTDPRPFYGPWIRPRREGTRHYPAYADAVRRRRCRNCLYGTLDPDHSEWVTWVEVIALWADLPAEVVYEEADCW